MYIILPLTPLENTSLLRLHTSYGDALNDSTTGLAAQVHAVGLRGITGEMTLQGWRDSFFVGVATNLPRKFQQDFINKGSVIKPQSVPINYFQRGSLLYVLYVNDLSQTVVNDSLTLLEFAQHIDGQSVRVSGVMAELPTTAMLEYMCSIAI